VYSVLLETRQVLIVYSVLLETRQVLIVYSVLLRYLPARCHRDSYAVDIFTSDTLQQVLLSTAIHARSTTRTLPLIRHQTSFNLDLDLQSHESYAHDPYTSIRSMLKVTRFTSSVERGGRTDRQTDTRLVHSTLTVTAEVSVITQTITDLGHHRNRLSYKHTAEEPF